MHECQSSVWGRVKCLFALFAFSLSSRSQPAPRAGSNEYGEAGVPVVVIKTIPAPVQVAGPLVAVGVSAGTFFSCAVNAAGRVLCWCAAAPPPARPAR